MSFGFDFGPMSGEIADRLHRGAIGIANAFPQAPDIAWSSQSAPTTPLPPERPAGLMSEAVAAPAKPAADPRADMPAPGAVPASTASPPPAASPTMSGPPRASGTPSPAPTANEDGSGFSFENFRRNGGMDLLGSIGMGLMSSPNWGDGVAKGLLHDEQRQTRKATTDLARAEYGLKIRKLAQETGALQGNASILKRAYPWMDEAQATAGAGNSALVTDALKTIRDPNSGRQMAEDGSGVRRWVDTGQSVFPGDSGKPLETYRQVTDPANGNEYNVNGRTGQKTLIAAGKTATDESTKIAERERALVDRGMDPKDPRNEDFILTGRRPREDQQQLTATDKTAIREGQDRARSALIAVQQLKSARKLSDKAYDGTTATQRAWLMSNAPDMLGGPGQDALDTLEMQQLIDTQALTSMKSIFGANPTEGERAALQKMQGSANQPMKLRNEILEEAIRQAEGRAQYEQDTVDQLRGGTFYRPQERGGPGAVQGPGQGYTPPAPQNPAAPQVGPATPATDPLSSARAAIAAGADRQKVMQRLLQNGINPKGL